MRPTRIFVTDALTVVALRLCQTATAASLTPAAPALETARSFAELVSRCEATQEIGPPDDTTTASCPEESRDVTRPSASMMRSANWANVSS